MRVRQSMLKTWMSCALMAKFSYVDHLPQKQNAKASFGTCVHAALEYYNRTGDVEVAVKLFQDLWENPEQLGVAPDTWPKYTTFGGLMNRGVDIIREYHDKQKWDDRDIVAIEHHFLVPFGRHELEGTVDLLEIKRNHKGKQLLRILDYKTNSRQPNFTELYLNIQFTAYDWAATQPEFWLGNGPDFPPMPNGEWWMEMLADAPRRGIWYQLWHNKELDAGPRTSADHERLYRVADEIEKAIAADVFVPTISSESCVYCSYADGPCPVSIPTQADVKAGEHAWLGS